MTDSITLIAPDDWHLHLRDGEALRYTVPHASSNFSRAIIMPNLVPPVTTAKMALDYKTRIMNERPKGSRFAPLMTLYLTDKTTASDIESAKNAGIVACKLYPAGATTNSDSGVTQIKHIYPALEAMEKCGMLLLVHGEVTQSDIDIFDREAVFIDQVLQPLTRTFPGLKVVMEHITTANAAQFVTESSDKVAATITAHHLLFNRNHMLAGGIRPHYYCLPILKRSTHQKALIQAATSGNKKFFLGTDSAPHAKSKKEASCGCAGSYTAFAPLSLYAEVFDAENALDKLEGFASLHGPNHYGLPHNNHSVTLVRRPWQVPESFPYMKEEKLTPIKAGETLQWQLANGELF